MEGNMFDFNAMQRNVSSAITFDNLDSGYDTIPKIFTSFIGSESDKRSVVDQAFREELKNIISCKNGVNIDNINEIQQFIDVVIKYTKLKLCTNNLPILLLGDIFDTVTLDICEGLFDYVEKNVKVWTSEPFYSNGKHHLLRMCNDMLRRLSKSQKTIFCGRIQLFLAQLFPLEEKSALNLMSTFHVENITVFKKNPSEFADDIGSESTEAEDGELTSNPVDYTLYVKFWSIQDFFRHPVQCYTNSGWRTFKMNVHEVLKVFESHKIEASAKSKKQNEPPLKGMTLPDIMSNCENTRNYFTKYLTNEKLLNLQMNDGIFRRYFLVQVLIVFQYLTGKVRFKNEMHVLSDSQISWIKDLTERIYVVLNEMPPNGAQFTKALQHIINREENWINWKNESCPSFQRPPVKKQDKTKEAIKRAKKRSIGDDYLTRNNKKVYMGTPELTRLWNLCPDNLEACKLESRLKFLPKLEDFFEEAIDQADPDAGIEDEYKLVKQPNFQWRALRLLARRSNHFFTPSNQPFRALPDYLSSVIGNLSETFKTPQEPKVELKQEPIEPADT